MYMQRVLFFISCLLSLNAFAQFTPTNGVQDKRPNKFLIQHVVVHVSANEVIQNSNVLIEQDVIKAIGKEIEIPEDAVLIDGQGKHMYPSFIELISDYGLPKPAKKKSNRIPQYQSNKKGAFHWNQAIHPEESAAAKFSPQTKQAKEYIQSGFGLVLTHNRNGISRGTGALVSLNNSPSKNLIQSRKAAFFSFLKGNSGQKYPSSLMGSIALLRQLFYDAAWYKEQENLANQNLSLEALQHQWELPFIFEANNLLNTLRVTQLATEFNKPFVIKGGNDMYKDLHALKEYNPTLILPLHTPKAIKIEHMYDAENVSLAKMKHWETAPYMPALVEDVGLTFAITTDKTNKNQFFAKLRKAVKNGLSPQKALEALTTVPANVLGISNEYGTIEVGKKANFILLNGNLFDTKTKLLENWVLGQQHVIKTDQHKLITGTYNLKLNQTDYTLSIRESSGKLTCKVTHNQKSIPANCAFKNGLIHLRFNSPDSLFPTPTMLSGKANFSGKILDGKAQTIAGEFVNWSAIKQESKPAKQTAKQDSNKLKLPSVWFPNMAYGTDSLLSQKNYFIDNATIWTCDSLGKFVGDVIVRNGKIEAVDRSLSRDESLIYIDGQNKHLTPGIVDEHSHIAVHGGVNEGTKASSAEVRIGDVINPYDINIYRQLAGGVTTSQLLHGSANPIGGQSVIIKLKWGQQAENMKIASAPGFIKFALGENVKQSNWGDREVIRFPQTRMGVEQVYYDHFLRAKAYDKKWQDWKVEDQKFKWPFLKSDNPKPRRDLELEALAEILNQERFITCHSYIQSEINMLLHVADSMHFTVNTFTHILEGYKLADKMKKHGAAGSTFADWWAYKYEVNDAIPYNAALMHEQGILTGINSDDAEMARRLNQEAAKAIKYGNVSEQEALKMVTINPAKMLHIDNQTGSILANKDADLVLWTDHPLSINAKVELTMIEGTIYYSEEQNSKLLKRNRAEKLRLIKLLLADKSKDKVNPETKPAKHYHCDTIEEYNEH